MTYSGRPAASDSGAVGLAEVLERVLDKGVVLTGDIQINLLDIELLTIKVRLLLASVDTAEKIGIDWWKHDAFLSGESRSREYRELADENAQLRERLADLEQRLGGPQQAAPSQAGDGSMSTGQSWNHGQESR